MSHMGVAHFIITSRFTEAKGGIQRESFDKMSTHKGVGPQILGRFRQKHKPEYHDLTLFHEQVRSH